MNLQTPNLKIKSFKIIVMAFVDEPVNYVSFYNQLY